MTTKDRVLKAFEQLPEDATIDDVIERLRFVVKIEQGLEDIEAGRVLAHDEVKARMQEIMRGLD